LNFLEAAQTLSGQGFSDADIIRYTMLTNCIARLLTDTVGRCYVVCSALQLFPSSADGVKFLQSCKTLERMGYQMTLIKVCVCVCQVATWCDNLVAVTDWYECTRRMQEALLMNENNIEAAIRDLGPV
jgi:hypothetical protein